MLLLALPLYPLPWLLQIVPAVTTTGTFVKRSTRFVRFWVGPIYKANFLVAIIIPVKEFDPFFSLIEIKRSSSGCSAGSVFSYENGQFLGSFFKSIIEFMRSSIEMQGIHNIRVAERSNVVEIWRPVGSSDYDYGVGVDCPDLGNNWFSVFFYFTPLNTVWLIADFIEHMSFGSMLRTHILPEAWSATVTLVIRIARSQDVPINQSIHTELSNPVDPLVDLALPVIWFRIVSLLVDIHSDSNHIHFPIICEFSEALIGIAVLKPLGTMCWKAS